MELPALIVPLAAPYTDDTSTLSEIRVARMMRWHIEQGAAGFLVGSESAEVTALSIGERQKLTEWVMRESGSRPVYVNITAGTTLATLALAQDAQDCGAAGGLLLPPPGAPLTEDEAKGYMAAVRRHGNLACSWIDPTGASPIWPMSYLPPVMWHCDRWPKSIPTSRKQLMVICLIFGRPTAFAARSACWERDWAGSFSSISPCSCVPCAS